MKQTLLVVLLAAGTVMAAGPVGTYLGFQLNRTAVTSGSATDSIHLELPAPGDSVMRSVMWDTTVISAELQVRGMDAYEFWRRSWVNEQLFASYDTAYETAGVYLRGAQVVQDTGVTVNRYRIPFAPDSAWTTGISGTYLLHFIGPDQYDTVTIWADTSRVVGIEEVTVPYGTVTDCYKIHTTALWRVATTIESIPVRCTLAYDAYEWYRDSLWMVKDSVNIAGPIWVKIFIWLQAGELVRKAQHELVALSELTGITQSPVSAGTVSRLRCEPDPFRQSCVIHYSGPAPARLRVVNPAGRTVFSSPIRGRLNWHPDRLPAGVYHMVVNDPSGRSHIARLVHLE